MVRGADTAVLGSAVDLAEAADTDSLAHVDVAGDGGGAHVVPVNVLRRELAGGAGLDGVDPAGDGELALTLQESGIGVDELLRLYWEENHDHYQQIFRHQRSFDPLAPAPFICMALNCPFYHSSPMSRIASYVPSSSGLRVWVVRHRA